MAKLLSSTLQKKLIRTLWMLSIFGVIGGIVFFVLLSNQDLPSFDDLENPKIELSSMVLSSDHKEIDRFFIKNRVPIRFEDLNPHLVDALIATEDERYYSHSGIDFRALARVGVKSVLMGQSSSGGGSTITQQLAKLLYPRNTKRMSRLEAIQHLVLTKFKEWITAVKLEKSYTKEEIIAMYLNKFDYLHDSHGIQAASETYFGKDQKDLNLQESAMLIGMLKNPSSYNPHTKPSNAVNRRNVVLHQMLKGGRITHALYDSLKVQPVDMSNFKRKSVSEGPAPYLMQEIRKRARDILSQPKYFKDKNTPYDIYKDGLQILTTIDPVVQKLTQQAVLDHMPKLQNNYWRHWRGMNPLTYDAEEDQINLRKKILQNMILETDRYQKMRYAILGRQIEEIKSKVEHIVMTDTEIEWMIDEGNKPGRIAGLQARGIIRKDKAKKMEAIMNSTYWPPFVKEYQDFKQTVESTFNKKVEMKVFDYGSPGFEKDTVMTPLDSIKYHIMFLQTGVMVMDAKAGYVKAWVGGVNHRYFKFDHVTANRQVGSTFKPFVYATGVINNISPCNVVVDQAYTISPGEGGFILNEPWTPQNSKGFSGESLNLKEGMKRSLNSFSVWMMKRFGSAKQVKQTAVNMGVPEEKILEVPSIALGTPELTVEEMTSAFSVFANNGEYNQPYIIRQIKDKNGKVIYEHSPKRQKAIPEKANYVMVDMLKYSIGGGKYGIESEVGGKTGTTNDHVDGWFMGFSPTLTVGVWVGGDYQWVRFRTLAEGQGAVMARPIFSNLMKKLEQQDASVYDKTATFYKPPGDLGITIDCDAWNQGLPDDEVDPFDIQDNTEDEFDIIEQ